MWWKKFVKPSKEELKKVLNSDQFAITQGEGTEPPFDNAYNDNKAEGLYVDVVSGEPLFSSKDKFDSGTGWPSFTRPIEKDSIEERTDFKMLYPRTEVRAKLSDSHLGHFFNDGPTGSRYCINSAALRFVPKEKLKSENYDEYEKVFQNEKAIFAGGCFWCMEPPFRNAKGVLDVIAGYTGGSTKNPTYEQVCSDRTGHFEAIKIVYDPNQISYGELLNIFWENIDPTDPGGQFADRGTSYKTAIFYMNDEQKSEALNSKDNLTESKKFDDPIATQILEAKEFYPAELNHQSYYKKNPTHYERYKVGSGRADFLEQNWNKK